MEFIFAGALVYLFYTFVLKRRGGRKGWQEPRPIVAPRESAPPPEPNRGFGRRRQSPTQWDEAPVPAPAPTPPPPPMRIQETVSAVLRRQVPVRFDAPERSWIGGLPMMPDGLGWPTGVSHEKASEGPRPLHFVAQIALADLPAELWSGLGPREGWLLVFLNPNLGYDYDQQSFRVIYTRELGSERPAPAALGPVWDGVYTGETYPHCRSVAEIPSTWRRWPVDVVAVPNQARIEEGRTLAAPAEFESLLYPGEPVERERHQLPPMEPFTWRGALYVVDGILRSWSKPLEPRKLSGSIAKRLSEPGYIQSILPAVDAQEAEVKARFRSLLDDPATDETRRAQIHEFAATRDSERERLAALLAEHPTPGSMFARLESEQQSRVAWHGGVAARLEAERSAILAHELDTPLPPEAWTALRERLSGDCHSFWSTDWMERDGDRLHVTFREIETCLLGKTTNHVPRALATLAADYYVDPQRRELLPEGLAEALEPHWRRLEENRPHRMGGYHDGLQSDAEIGPQTQLLLLQLASDDAMQWCWGDSGAFFVFIDPPDLADGDFGKVTVELECH
jgi:uncharacterized protein YwqG